MFKPHFDIRAGKLHILDENQLKVDYIMNILSLFLLISQIKNILQTALQCLCSIRQDGTPSYEIATSS